MGRKRILVPWFINDHTTCGGPLSYRTKNWSWLKVGYTINGEAVLKVVSTGGQEMISTAPIAATSS